MNAEPTQDTIKLLVRFNGETFSFDRKPNLFGDPVQPDGYSDDLYDVFEALGIKNGRLVKNVNGEYVAVSVPLDDSRKRRAQSTLDSLRNQRKATFAISLVMAAICFIAAAYDNGGARLQTAGTPLGNDSSGGSGTALVAEYDAIRFASSVSLVLAFCLFFTSVMLAYSVTLFIELWADRPSLPELNYRVWFPSAGSFYTLLAGALSMLLGLALGLYPHWSLATGHAGATCALAVICGIFVLLNIAAILVTRRLCFDV
jgi:hypothetical protein